MQINYGSEDHHTHVTNEEPMEKLPLYYGVWSTILMSKIDVDIVNQQF